MPYRTSNAEACSTEAATGRTAGHSSPSASPPSTRTWCCSRKPKGGPTPATASSSAPSRTSAWTDSSPRPAPAAEPPCYRRETLGRRIAWNTDYTGTETHHGFGVAGFTIPGLPAPLAVTSVHLTPYSADRAVAEADFAASRTYRHGPYCILGGDINYPPAAGPDPAWDRMRPYNRGSRTLLTDPTLQKTAPVPDRRIAWKLAANGLTDTAWHLYQQTGDELLLRRTGNDDRIDQLWVSTPLAPAVLSYTLLDTPPDASDHHGLAVALDTSRIDTTQPWTYE
ncbi:hypothetical protein ACI1MP_37695 (plasmid) [Kitasatospora griseola]|uniref:hypothetical protein n=1 Tax=Kitasatospora griseola TaxID=2064 RepID=UPI003855BC7E